MFWTITSPVFYLSFTLYVALLWSALQQTLSPFISSLIYTVSTLVQSTAVLWEACTRKCVIVEWSQWQMWMSDSNNSFCEQQLWHNSWNYIVVFFCIHIFDYNPHIWFVLCVHTHLLHLLLGITSLYAACFHLLPKQNEEVWKHV